MLNPAVKIKHLLFLYIIVTTINSCITPSYAFKDYSKEDAAFFELVNNDTILDYSGKNLFYDNYLFTQNNNLHFYINIKKNEKAATKNVIDKYSKKMFVSNFKHAITLIEEEDGSLMNSNSMDKIILTKINIRYKNIDLILNHVKRILKPDGLAIVSVSAINSFDSKKYGTEQSFITFFESKGFKILKTKTYTEKNKKRDYTLLQLRK